MPAPLFSAIVVTYNRLPWLTEVLTGLQGQTWANIEIIVVDNGSTDGTSQFLTQLAEAEPRIKLIAYEENQFSLDDPWQPFSVCGNAGLQIATGDYVFFHPDNVLLSDDYVAKMVALFQEDVDCTSALGQILIMDLRGSEPIPFPDAANLRPRHVSGLSVAIDKLRGGNKLGGNGSMLTVKRDVLVKAGGYHRAADLAMVCGILPFGVTGFDHTAHFYIRDQPYRPDLIMARTLTRRRDTLSLLKDWEIQHRWQVFGNELAMEVESTLKGWADKWAAYSFFRWIYTGHFKMAFRLFRSMGTHRRFLLGLPANIWQPLWWRATVRLIAKPFVRLGFRLLPGLAKGSPALARLYERVRR